MEGGRVWKDKGCGGRKRKEVYGMRKGMEGGRLKKRKGVEDELYGWWKGKED